MKLRTQLLLGFGVVFTVILVVVGISYQTTRSLLNMNTSVEHAHEIMTKARKVQKLVVDMQARKRGFLITGKDAYLAPFEETIQEYKEEIAELRVLVTNDPQQTERVEEVEKLVHRWTQTISLPQIEERRKVNRGEATLSEFIGKVQEEEGGEYQLFENVRSELSAFIDAHRAQLNYQQEAAATAADRNILAVLLVAIAGSLLGVGAMLYVVRSTLRQVGGEPSAIAAVTEQIANGNLDIQIEGGTGIRASVARMLEALRTNRDHTQRQDWLKTGIARLNGAMNGDPEIDVLASKVISEMATYLDAQVGAFYILNAESGTWSAEERESPQAGEHPDSSSAVLRLVGSYAYTKRKKLSNVFKLGEGLVGQAALEKHQILVKNVPEDYVKVTSGLGERIPTFICVTPFLYEERVKGVVEIGTLSDMSDQQMDYLTQAMPALAIAVESAHSRTQLARSLEESQRLTEELQAQQEELKAANEELEEQTQRLQESEERLKTQQEELEVTNEELEEKNDLLERQKREVEQARRQIEEKAAEVALASKYKSEFLANMSHELRTPLNSLLLLAQGLAENREGNLTADQVESAKIVYNSGSDLLQLINEILDLSKIESGRVELQSGQVRVSDLAEGVRTSFDHLCKEKGIDLEVTIADDAPITITSDGKRVQQIIRNLVSNAVKFTEKGGVTVTFERGTLERGREKKEGIPRSSIDMLCISIADTGIGIVPEKQKVVFEAFQQADGGTARKYGGTGLGLSISRELAHLLGGEIHLESEPGKGSTFSLYLPIELGTRSAERGSENERTVPSSAFRAPRSESSAFRVPRSEDVPSSIADDRENLQAGDRAILVIEDDPKFARILFNKCHERGFKCLAAPTGEMGLELAARHLPTAVILDIRLPGMDGWSVLQAIKEDTHTRHIPVHVISIEQSSTESLRKGAVGHVVKPVTLEDLEATFQKLEQVSPGQPKRVLVVEDDPKMRGETVRLIGNGDVTVDEADTGSGALEALRTHRYQCMVLDLGLPDMDGYELLAAIEKEGLDLPPVIVHTARDLTYEQEMALREHAESIVIKDVRSQERLLDEVSLFLHRVVNRMPGEKQKIIHDLYETDTLLRDKKVLVVDDDMRTAFAISRLLSERGIVPLKAENGERALRLIEEHPDVDLVLMDIMMPVMDGYETIRQIRNPKSKIHNHKVPIIALTAKAMPEDREKCLAAGANDYLPKPVDGGRLISMMRVWLYR